MRDCDKVKENLRHENKTINVYYCKETCGSSVKTFVVVRLPRMI